MNIVRRAIEEPIRQIVSNTGLDAPVVVNQIKGQRGDAGFNAASGEYEKLFKAGVIDSAKGCPGRPPECGKRVRLDVDHRGGGGREARKAPSRDGWSWS